MFYASFGKSCPLRRWVAFDTRSCRVVSRSVWSLEKSAGIIGDECGRLHDELSRLYRNVLLVADILKVVCLKTSRGSMTDLRVVGALGHD